MRSLKRTVFGLLLVCLFASACQPIGISAGSAGQHPSLYLRGHVSGAALAVAVQGNYAYLGFSYELVVLDIADRSHPQWVTALPLPATDIALAGHYAYVVGRDGFTVVDIAEPTHPQLLGHLTSAATGASVVVTESDVYFVEDHRLHQVDITDPMQPQIKHTLSLPLPIEQLAVADGYLYLSGYDGVHVLAIAKQTLPSEVCFIETGAYTSGVAVANGHAFFVSREVLQVVDMMNPEACHSSHQIAFLGMVVDLRVVDNIAYLVNGSRGLRVWDLADPQTSVEIGAYPAHLALSLVVQDGYLYVVDCNEGLQIFAIADPAHLQLVGVFTPLGAADKLVVSSTYAYVAAGFPSHLHQIAVVDPAQMHTIRRHLITDQVYGLALAGETLYLTVDGGLQSIDLAAPDEPKTLARYSLSDPTIQKLWHVAVNQNYAYLGDNAGNVWLVNLAEPTRVIDLTTYRALGNVAAMALTATFAYLPYQGAGVRILKVAANGQLTQVGLYTTPETIYKIAVAQGYAYLAGPQGLSIVDVHDPTIPLLVGHYALPDVAYDVAIVGNYALVAAGGAGLVVLDVATPAQLVVVATYGTLDYARQVVSANGLIYVADRLGGLSILALTVP